jgi:hypothetical protein
MISEIDIIVIQLFGRMMRESSVYDDSIVEAIRRIRGATVASFSWNILPVWSNRILRWSASQKYITIALTNNYAKSEDNILGDAPRHPDFSLQKELEFLGWQDGATPLKMRELFDDFCDSSTLGLRKPDPAFYLLACKRNSIRPEEAVFLDDIG